MSNKLKKVNEAMVKAKKKIEELIAENDGVNLTPQFMKNEFTEVEEEKDRISEDEFYNMVSEMAESGEYCLYKVEKITEGKPARGLMICAKNTELVFMNKDKFDKDVDENLSGISESLQKLANAIEKGSDESEEATDISEETEEEVKEESVEESTDISEETEVEGSEDLEEDDRK